MTIRLFVCFHLQTNPISHSGKELLRYPCGQSLDYPDHKELFEGSEVKVSCL